MSARQARRYLDLAAQSGPVPVPETNVVFTVKLPVGLAGRVRDHARDTGVPTITVCADLDPSPSIWS